MGTTAGSFPSPSVPPFLGLPPFHGVPLPNWGQSRGTLIVVRQSKDIGICQTCLKPWYHHQRYSQTQMRGPPQGVLYRME